MEFEADVSEICPCCVQGQIRIQGVMRLLRSIETLSAAEVASILDDLLSA